MHQHPPHIHHDRCGHSHSHLHHAPGDRVGDKVTRLTYVLGLVSGFSMVELAIGWYSHSMALLADASHLFFDCFALLLALLGAWIAQKTNADGQRIEIAIALFNGLSLLAIGSGIALEAIWQLQTPSVEILSKPMLAAAAIGLAVNSANILLLHDLSHDDLNLKGAFLHVIADALSSIGVLLAALAVWRMHWLWADSLISLPIAGLIVASALPLVKQSFKLLAEGSGQTDTDLTG